MAAVTGIAFVWLKASLTFLILLLGGFATGLVMGFATGFLLRTVRNHAPAVLSLMLLAPFVTYLLAEELHCSGVIAVVVLRIIIARLSDKKFPDGIKKESKTIWDLIVFLLNGFIFILLGLEFPMVIRMIETSFFYHTLGTPSSLPL